MCECMLYPLKQHSCAIGSFDNYLHTYTEWEITKKRPTGLSPQLRLYESDYRRSGLRKALAVRQNRRRLTIKQAQIVQQDLGNTVMGVEGHNSEGSESNQLILGRAAWELMFLNWTFNLLIVMLCRIKIYKNEHLIHQDYFYFSFNL